MYSRIRENDGKFYVVDRNIVLIKIYHKISFYLSILSILMEFWNEIEFPSVIKFFRSGIVSSFCMEMENYYIVMFGMKISRQEIRMKAVWEIITEGGVNLRKCKTAIQGIIKVDKNS